MQIDGNFLQNLTLLIVESKFQSTSIHVVFNLSIDFINEIDIYTFIYLFIYFNDAKQVDGLFYSLFQNYQSQLL